MGALISTTEREKYPDTVAVRLGRDTAQRLREIARQEDRSTSQVARRLLIGALDAAERTARE